jgi:mono/diheme cytochrome c family protein
MSGGPLSPGSGLHQQRPVWPAGVFFLSILLACGGERGSRAPAAGESGQTPAPSDSTMTSSTDTAASARPDTAGTASARPDFTPPSPAPDTSGMRQAASKKPSQTAAAPKPATTPKPTTSSSPDSTATSVAPAPAQPTKSTQAAPTQNAEAKAPLRDQYHTAPLDTVTQQVYDGWKQFNLNCARCHGEDVQGTTIAPHLIVSLKPDGPINSKELFVQTVCAGRPAKGMPSWCALGLGMDKIDAIYSYVKGRSDAKIHPGRPAVKPAG